MAGVANYSMFYYFDQMLEILPNSKAKLTLAQLLSLQFVVAMCAISILPSNAAWPQHGLH